MNRLSKVELLGLLRALFVKQAHWLFIEAARIYTAIGNTEWVQRASDAAAPSNHVEPHGR